MTAIVAGGAAFIPMKDVGGIDKSDPCYGKKWGVFDYPKYAREHLTNDLSQVSRCRSTREQSSPPSIEATRHSPMSEQKSSEVPRQRTTASQSTLLDSTAASYLTSGTTAR